jgi:ribosome recycling factor
MSNTNFDEFEKKAESTVAFLAEELKKIRSGRATPSIVEDINVEAYGATQPVKNIGNINVADPTLLVIQPWDKSLLPNIVKAIVAENLGLNPQINGDLIRVPMPPLTEERRKEYVKLMKDKLEEARISIRNVRKEVLTTLKSDQEQGIITEDDLERYEKELQKLVDGANQDIEKKGEAKEQELMTI